MRTVRHFVSGRELNRIYPHVTVMDAVHFLVNHNTGTCAVFEGPRLVGVFSERDLLQRVVARGKDPAKTLVSEVMTKNPVSVFADQDVDACLLKMTQARCRHLPVFDGDRYLGMVSMRDLMMDCADELKHELDELKHYMNGEAAV
ncbi:MAG: CBS domain-containing protein [Planctomycetota bacterium]